MKKDQNKRIPSKAIIRINPDFEELFIIAGEEIPTKQEKYKQIWRNFYIKKEIDKNKIFEQKIRDILNEKRGHDWPITDNVELVISISTSLKRIKQVDIDNLLKSIFDAIKTVLIKEDSQIHVVLAEKQVLNEKLLPYPESKDQLIVAFRRIKDNSESIFQSLKLCSIEEIY